MVMVVSEVTVKLNGEELDSLLGVLDLYYAEFGFEESPEKEAIRKKLCLIFEDAFPDYFNARY